jgi:hypothetical protein
MNATLLSQSPYLLLFEALPVVASLIASCELGFSNPLDDFKPSALSAVTLA